MISRRRLLYPSHRQLVPNSLEAHLKTTCLDQLKSKAAPLASKQAAASLAECASFFVGAWTQSTCFRRPGKLNGKTAVITGGATGIGLAAAKRFVEEGAFVFIFGRRQESLDAAVAQLGANARAVKGSVSDLADLDRLYEAVKAERGSLDIVFANAGVGGQLPLGKITVEHIDEAFDTNVKGSIFTVQKALPLLGPGGSIILTGSSAGTTGAPAMSAYSSSKAAVRNLARSFAEDLKGTGIRVNVLSPGPTATELAVQALGEEGVKAFGSLTPLKRMADAAEIGAVAAFLASSDSSFMTGSEVAVDGGLAQT